MVATVSAERVTSPAVVIPTKSNDAPQTPTGRKRPCCTKCGKPMLGHKRGQCDADSTPTNIKKEEEDKLKEGVNLTQQFADLQIDENRSGDEYTFKEKRLGKVDGRRRSSTRLSRIPKAETLASLTTNDKAVLETLGKPGMMSKDVVIDESASRAKIERWLDSVPASESSKRGRQKRQSDPPIELSRGFDAMLDLPLKKVDSTKKSSPARSAKPLGRTSSVVEREEFFRQLAQNSKKHIASVFTMEMKDIQTLEENAKRLKLHARVIAPKYADGSTGDGWLVVGKDEDSVKEVFAEVEKDVKSGNGMGYMSRLGHIATGAVIAWMYLAFS